jgi:uncharacterized protein (TIGR00299 family) protein
MRVLYFDCFSGISGDMVLGAFLDIGVDPEYLKAELEKLNVPGFNLEINKTTKKGIGGTRCKVVIDKHEHQHRHLSDIKKIINESLLSQEVKNTAIAIFKRVAEAEGSVHQIPAERVHFHEVGAIDSIVDIVGAAICYHALAPDAVYGSAINTGSGFVKCAHGIMPVPAPATFEIIKDSDFSIYAKHSQMELATPTGAAILTTIAQYKPEFPKMSVEKIGYGFGEHELDTLNGLRICIGQIDKKNDSQMYVIETNIDDMTGEMAGFVMEKLLGLGVADVFYTPVYMKKNRPGIKLTVLCHTEQKDEVEYLILKETPSIGIRRYAIDRTIMQRNLEKVSTVYGDITVKTCIFEDIKKISPEYEDIKRIAHEKKKSLKEIMDLAERAILEKKETYECAKIISI